MIEYLPLVLTGIGIIISILYYASVLRNANRTQQMHLETRQAQLYTQIVRELFSEEYMKKSIHLLKMEWDDYDDFERKYGSDTNEDSYAERYSVWYFMNNIGFLLHENLINVETANALVSQFALWDWAKFKDVIYTQREVYKIPDFLEWFEYLANELTKYRISVGLSTEIHEDFGSYQHENP